MAHRCGRFTNRPYDHWWRWYRGNVRGVGLFAAEEMIRFQWPIVVGGSRTAPTIIGGGGIVAMCVVLAYSQPRHDQRSMVILTPDS